VVDKRRTGLGLDWKWTGNFLPQTLLKVEREYGSWRTLWNSAICYHLCINNAACASFECWQEG